MRIVSGKWAGRDLVSPGQSIRPTAEAVRDRWLEILSDSLEGARVLDLFAGSGALGLEALSRGAASVDFVENGSASLHALKANVARKLDRVVGHWHEVPFSTILSVEHQRQHRLEGKAKRYDLPGETRITVFVSPHRRPGS